ncbi:MAG: EAL domain-containing protein [Burkholderiales bacterium]|nr:EAL domain-containing protein [Burkholderiales bacterium]
MGFLLPRSLIARLLTLFALALALTVGAGLVVSYQLQFLRQVEDAQQSGQIVAEASARFVAEAMSGDGEGLRQALSKAVSGTSFRSAELRTISGIHLVHHGTEPLRRAAPDWLVRTVAARLPMVEVPVTSGARTLGVLRLHPAAERFAALYWDSLRLMLVFGALCLSLTLAAVGYLLSRWIGGLERLGRVESRIRAGVLDAAAEVDRDAPLEIRRAAEMLNNTTASLRAQFAHAQSAARETIAQLSSFDSLTGLPNRASFFEAVEARIARAGHDPRPFAVVHFDLFDFKDVNDACGHAAGDRALAEVGRALRQALAAEHAVARVGGDEFAVLVDGFADAAAIETMVADVCAAVEGVALPDAAGVALSASLGVACFPRDGADGTTLLKHAEIALHRAKAGGRRASVYFSAELERAHRERTELERELRLALERGQLHLEYQPKYHLGFGQVVGAEALLRWSHPVLGNVSPARFIPVAEATGLIVPIGRWIIEEVCRQIHRWEDQGMPSIQVALNLSALQLREPRLFEDIEAILATAEVLPGQIELEITESLLMADPESAVALLRRLRDAGFSIAIDDFGTGYSSLAYLKKFPVGVLKIDRSFVKDISVDMDDRAIAAAIVSLAGSLLLDVVAEGVETIEQVDVLRELGCDYLQGYYISRPLRGDAFATFVRRSREHGVEVARLPLATEAPAGAPAPGQPLTA